MDDILNKCFKKDESIVSRRIAGEVILVPICRNIGDVDNIYTLNEVGARIWELIDGKNSINDIKRILNGEYDEEEEEIEKDIFIFTEQLEEIKAVAYEQHNPDYKF